MLKRILCTLCALIILIPLAIVPASAEDTTSPTHSGSSGSFGDDLSNVNLWTYENWKEYLSSDYAKSLSIDVLKDFVNLDYSIDDIDSVFRFDKNFISDSSFLKSSFWYLVDGEYYYSDSSLEDEANLNVSGDYCQYYPVDDEVSEWKNTEFSNLFSVSYSGTYSDNYCYIVDDIEVYKSLAAKFSNNPCKDQIYFCADIIQSFIDYIIGVDIDLNPIVAPNDFDENAIKYSNYIDCPYSKYHIKPYEVETENFVSVGLFTDLNLYYDNYFNLGSTYDHSETIDFYIDVSNAEDFETLNLIGFYQPNNNGAFSFDGDLLNKINSQADWDKFFNSHFRAVHYERDIFSSLDFFNYCFGSNYTSFNDFVRIVNIKGKAYIKFTLNSSYTVSHTGVGIDPGSSNLTNTNTLFVGTRVTHTATSINPETGDIGGNGAGLGSDISQADDELSRPPTKKDLEDLGFKHGFSNTSGSYPYKVTIYRNGSEYFQMFFSKMPSVTSTYYSDKCIDYGLNVYNTKTYMYFKEQNMSREFDFTYNNTFDELVEEGGFYDEVVYKPITAEVAKVLNTILNIDTSEFNNTYTFHMWTNYTGEFPDNYNGFYCKFNWDLENSGHFQKNNSDDDYDYSKDYEADESFTDNNGNIHGGAVETPTESPDYNGFNNEDFSFDENNLWKYADSFLGFCARAFKILPSFIWQLIACSIVIVIILRVLSR